MFSTYIGGFYGDLATGITLDNNGSAYIGGITASPNFPVMNPFQSEMTGYMDGFITTLSTEGQSLNHSTYLGGAYPSPTDINLNGFFGLTINETGINPNLIWLVVGIVFFFFISLLIRKIIGFKKYGQQE